MKRSAGNRPTQPSLSARFLGRVLVLACLLLVPACGSVPDSATTGDTAGLAVTATPHLTPAHLEPSVVPASPVRESVTASPEPSTQPSPEADPAQLAAELATIVSGQLPPVPTTSVAEPISPAGLTGVQVIALEGGATGRPLWAVSSVGVPPPGTQHFVALFTQSAGGWQELTRIMLATPPVLDEHSVAQVRIDPRRIWLEVRGRSGLTGPCCYDLLSFDGTTLRNELSYQERYFEATLEDVNADGMPEVVLTIQPYGGASGWPQRRGVKLFRWDGAHMGEVRLVPVPPSVPDAGRRAVEEAVVLAQAELWKDAEAAITQTTGIDPASTASWNAVLILRNAAVRAQAVAESPARDIPHRFLYTLYYGDYPAALSMLRRYPLPVLFGREPTLIQEIDWLEGWTEAVTTSATLAVQARPDLAAAYFLRGWGAYLADPGNPAALADLERAAALAPDEPLFGNSVTYLKRDG